MIKKICTLLILTLVCAAAQSRPKTTRLEPPIFIADFDGKKWPAGWVAKGESFAKGPLRNIAYSTGGLSTRVKACHKSQGTLTSPPIKVERQYLIMSLNGGFDKNKLYVEILLDGKVIDRITRPQKQKKHVMQNICYDWSRLKEKSVPLRLVDRASQGYAWMMVDDIMQVDIKPVTREFTVDGEYLMLPVGKEPLAVFTKAGLYVNYTITIDDKLFGHGKVQFPLKGKILSYKIIKLPQADKGKKMTITFDVMSEEDRKVADFTRQGYKQTVSILADKKYLAIPRGIGTSPTTWFSLKADGKLLYEHNTPIGLEEPRTMVNLDISPYKGQKLEISFIHHDKNVAGLIRTSDEILGQPNLYKEADRPQVHFTYRNGNNMDVVGLTYYKKQWHLFTIHNPLIYSNRFVQGGEKAWAHAVSDDLVHWEEKAPIFLNNYRLTNGVGFVDKENLLGLNTKEHQTMVLLIPERRSTDGWDDKYSRGVCLVTSIDGGKTWSDEQVSNPIVSYPADPRVDAPRVYYSKKFNRWVLYVKKKNREVHQYISTDLRTWKRIEDVPAIAEMLTYEGDPGELIDMNLDGDPDKPMTISLFGLMGYIVGRYEDKGFCNLQGQLVKPEDIIIDEHMGYPMTFNSHPEGRVVVMANSYKPVISIPRELTLRSTKDGPRLFRNPVKELDKLHGRQYKKQNIELNNNQVLFDGPETINLRVKAIIDLGDARVVGMNIRGAKVIYDVEKQQLSLRNRKVSLEPQNGKIKFEAIIDARMIEVFANDGLRYLDCNFNISPAEPGKSPLAFYAAGGNAKVTEATVYELKSIWE